MLLSALVLLLAAAPVQDRAKELASADVDVRLRAIRAVAESGHPEAEKLLLKALEDDDWEIVGIAVAQLGTLRSKKAFEPLVALALEGPVRGVRRAAAESLLLIDGPAAYEKISRKLSGDSTLAALQATFVLAPSIDGEVKLNPFERLLKEKDKTLREEVARSLVAIAGAERAVKLAELANDEDIAVCAAALEGAAASADQAVAEVLYDVLGRAALDDVLERRVQRALRAIFVRHTERRGELLSALAKAAESSGPARPRFPRALGVVAQERDLARGLDPEPALAALQPFLADPGADVRAAAAGALARIASEPAFDRALELAARDPEAHVRKVALGVAARGRGPKHAPTQAALVERLANDSDVSVREEAAVGLGAQGLTGAARAALEKALSDPEWNVATCAAISLGKAGLDAGAKKNGEALIRRYQTGGEDWRQRASAVAGLALLNAKDGVPTMIEALEDAEPLIARMAYEYLASIAHQRLDPKKAVWDAWWLENSRRVTLALPEEVLEKRKRMQYARSPEEIYAGLDVLVLQSRGDHIENVLTDCAIEHRLTNQGKVVEDGPQPGGVFVVNCTGELNPDEAARLNWFVRAGGSVFASCWALRQTIQHLQPGLVKRKGSDGEIVGEVPAYPCDPSSPFLVDVFPPDVRPIYHLEGAFLIDAVDREQVEVLIDSPECARDFRGGNLAAWFRIGHGMVLASANHFESQGFLSAKDLERPEDRQVYAVEHLGLPYDAWRATRKERFWGRAQTAAEKVKDLSVFRLVTNFVRWKRLSQE